MQTTPANHDPAHGLNLTIAAALAPHMPGIIDPAAVRLEQYRRALQQFNWQFEHCDDHARWKRSKTELERLRAEQPAVDPDGAVWRTYAPLGFCVGIPAQVAA